MRPQAEAEREAATTFGLAPRINSHSMVGHRPRGASGVFPDAPLSEVARDPL